MGQHKLLLDVAGEVLVKRSARALLESGLAGLLVVLGREPEEVRRALTGLDYTFVVNPNYLRGGLSSSLALALRTLGELAPPVSGAVLGLADMPFVGPAHHRRVLEAAQGEQAAISFYGEVLAPPHFIPRSAFARVQDILEDGLPKPLPRALITGAQRVSQPPADLLDIDDEPGYVQALARLALEQGSGR
ncbi:hypothetical protein GCM10022631_00140 [Deinococcus rubellus]